MGWNKFAREICEVKRGVQGMKGFSCEGSNRYEKIGERESCVWFYFTEYRIHFTVSNAVAPA